MKVDDRELLKEILDRDGEFVFEGMFDFYSGIFRQKPDLVVCMSRKAWCVIHLFLPFLEEKGVNVDSKKLTHDRMLHPWFAEQDKNKRGEIKVFVIDDTFQTGRALDDCFHRLRWVYGVAENNITVSVFAVTDSDQNKKRIDIKNNRYTVYPSGNPNNPSFNKPSFEVNWGGGTFYHKDTVLKFSNFFVEALHACSVPYTGYIPAFSLPVEVVQDYFGIDEKILGYLEQEDLTKEPFRNSEKMGFFNITNPQMNLHDVEAFYITLPEDNKLPFFPPDYALSVAALRFYLNRKTRIALVVPYLSLKDCKADAKIVEMFPDVLQSLMPKMCSEKDWSDHEERLAAYRLLRYASGYLWGKHIIKQWFGRDIADDVASNGGICSDIFVDWLNGSAEQDLAKIWPFFAPETGNVVKETPILEQYNEANLKKIIEQDMPEDIDFLKAINDGLSLLAPVDYFGIISRVFRGIFIRERERLIEYEKENNEELSLAPPFHGFPIHAFFSILLLKFSQLKTRKDVLATVTLMLCDMGIAVTQLCQHHGVIGTVLLNGEQSCNALASIAPEYARFLSEFPKLLSDNKKDQREEKFEMAKAEIQGYLKYEESQGLHRRLSADDLLTYLEEIKPFVVDYDPQREFYPYSVLPKSSFFDCSELFFSELREKLIA